MRHAEHIPPRLCFLQGRTYEGLWIFWWLCLHSMKFLGPEKKHIAMQKRELQVSITSQWLHPIFWHQFSPRTGEKYESLSLPWAPCGGWITALIQWEQPTRCRKRDRRGRDVNLETGVRLVHLDLFHKPSVLIWQKFPFSSGDFQWEKYHWASRLTEMLVRMTAGRVQQPVQEA